MANNRRLTLEDMEDQGRKTRRRTLQEVAEWHEKYNLLSDTWKKLFREDFGLDA